MEGLDQQDGGTPQAEEPPGVEPGLGTGGRSSWSNGATTAAAAADELKRGCCASHSPRGHTMKRWPPPAGTAASKEVDDGKMKEEEQQRAAGAADLAFGERQTTLRMKGTTRPVHGDEAHTPASVEEEEEGRLLTQQPAAAGSPAAGRFAATRCCGGGGGSRLSMGLQVMTALGFFAALYSGFSLISSSRLTIASSTDPTDDPTSSSVLPTARGREKRPHSWTSRLRELVRGGGSGEGTRRSAGGRRRTSSGPVSRAWQQQDAAAGTSIGTVAAQRRRDDDVVFEPRPDPLSNVVGHRRPAVSTVVAGGALQAAATNLTSGGVREAELGVALARLVREHYVQVLYDGFSRYRIMKDHLFPLMRVLPGRLVVVVAHGKKKPPSLGTAKLMTCAELLRFLADSRRRVFVTLNGLENLGCRRTSTPARSKADLQLLSRAAEQQVVRLWHGVDLLGTANKKDTGLVRPEVHVFRGEGARTYQTTFPTLAFTRPLFRESADVRELLNLTREGSSSSSRPVVLWFQSKIPHWIPMPQRCAEALTSLAEADYDFVVVPHPIDCATSSYSPAFKVLGSCQMGPVPDGRVSGLGASGLVHAADIVLSDLSTASIPTLVIGLEHPRLMLVALEEYMTWLEQSWPADSYPDGSMVPILRPWRDPANHSTCADVEVLLREARHRSEEQRRRQTVLFRRIHGCIDGYEEYRTAFAILRGLSPPHSSSSGGPLVAALRRLQAMYSQLNVRGPANGVLYVDGLCDPVDGPAKSSAAERWRPPSGATAANAPVPPRRSSTAQLFERGGAVP